MERVLRLCHAEREGSQQDDDGHEGLHATSLEEYSYDSDFFCFT